MVMMILGRSNPTLTNLGDVLAVNGFLSPMYSDWVFISPTLRNYFQTFTQLPWVISDKCLNHGRVPCNGVHTPSHHRFFGKIHVTLEQGLFQDYHPGQGRDCGKTSVSSVLSGFEDVAITPRRAQPKIDTYIEMCTTKF